MGSKNCNCAQRFCLITGVHAIFWVHFGSNWRAEIERQDNDKSCNYNGLGLGDYSPEKAGVGGSIPSLATIESITYAHRKPSVCSNLFQFTTDWPARKPDKTVFAQVPELGDMRVFE